jgi:hypothetical protein
MRIRCGRSRRWPGGVLAGTAAGAVRAYAGIGFGLPGTAAPDHHLQGHVAELVWNRLIQERVVCRDRRRLVHAHPVEPDPLEPGGDGLVIYETDAGVLVFRLWEIKKRESDTAISATIGRASRQLSSRGQEYLAKRAGPETVEQAGALSSCTPTSSSSGSTAAPGCRWAPPRSTRRAGRWHSGRSRPRSRASPGPGSGSEMGRRRVAVSGPGRPPPGGDAVRRGELKAVPDFGAGDVRRLTRRASVGYAQAGKGC